MGKTYLTKADFLAGITLTPQDFEVEGLGMVQVRGLNMVDLDELRSKFGDNEIMLMLHGAHRGLVNPQLSVDDLDVFGQGNPDIIVAIGKRVFELSGRGDKKELDPLAGGTLSDSPTQPDPL